MLHREIITVYSENHMKHLKTLCRQNAEFLYVIHTGAEVATEVYRISNL
jgi:hypothetical protein